MEEDIIRWHWNMPVLSLFACPELVEGERYKTELEDGIRLAYKDFLENPKGGEVEGR